MVAGSYHIYDPPVDRQVYGERRKSGGVKREEKPWES